MLPIVNKKPEDKFLLSIAIPTYNRASYLKLCLSQICKQLNHTIQPIEVIVSNNNSTDQTEVVINEIIASGIPITHLRNSQNIGAELNVIQCYKMAKGKYVLILGDDDVLLDNSLNKILHVLKRGEYGVIFLRAFGYKTNYMTEIPGDSEEGFVVCTSHERFLEKVNYYITFLSSNIVNKSLLADSIDPSLFVGTNLPQLSWILPAVLRAHTNAYSKEYLIAGKASNTGGYQLCQVFAVNINRIFKFLVMKGAEMRYFKVINRALLRRFFPYHLLLLRTQSEGSPFVEEDKFRVLCRVFGMYPSFWLVTVPAIKFPLWAATYWNKYVLRLLKIAHKINNAIEKLPWKKRELLIINK